MASTIVNKFGKGYVKNRKIKECTICKYVINSGIVSKEPLVMLLLFLPLILLNQNVYAQLSEFSPEVISSGIQIVLIFLISLLIPVGIVVYRYAKEGFELKITKSGVFLVILLSIITLVTTVASIIYEGGPLVNLIVLANLLKETNAFAIFSVTIIIGIIIGMILAINLGFVKYFGIQMTLDLKIFLIASVSILSIAIVDPLFRILPFISSELVFFDYYFFNNAIYENAKNLVTLYGGLDKFFRIPIGTILVFWAPIAFFIYLTTYLIKSQKKIKSKLIICCITLSIVFGVLLISINPLFPTNQQEGLADRTYSLMESTSLFATAIVAFVAAEGYVKTIRGGLQNLKHSDSHTALNQEYTLRNKVKKIFAFAVLLFIIIGFVQSFFLIGALFDFSPVASVAVFISSYYAFVNFESVQDQADFIYTSMKYFFFAFLIIDRIMLLKGYGEEFLNKENMLFGFFEKQGSGKIAISLMAFVTIFISVGLATSTLPIDFVDELPHAVMENYPSFTPQQRELFEIRSEQLVVISTIQGIGFLLGIFYMVMRTRTKPRKQKQDATTPSDGCGT